MYLFDDSKKDFVQILKQNAHGLLTQQAAHKSLPHVVVDVVTTAVTDHTTGMYFIRNQTSLKSTKNKPLTMLGQRVNLSSAISVDSKVRCNQGRTRLRYQHKLLCCALVYMRRVLHCDYISTFIANSARERRFFNYNEYFILMP